VRCEGKRCREEVATMVLPHQSEGDTLATDRVVVLGPLEQRM
jgi:hypothetical protein